MKKSLLIIIALLLYFIDQAQIQTNYTSIEIDSLINAISHFEGKEKIDQLNLISGAFSELNPDSCLFYANCAIDLSSSLNYKFGKAIAKFQIGNGYYFMNKLKNALLNYFEALSLLEKLEPSKPLGDLLSQIGLIHYNGRSMTNAIDYFKKAIRVFELTEDVEAKYYVQRLIFHAYLGKFKNLEALQYVEERTNYYKDHDQILYACCLNEMGVIYSEVDSPEKNDSLAMEYFLKGLKVSEAIQDTINIGVIATNIGNMFTDWPLSEHNFSEGENYLLHGINAINLTKRYALQAEIYIAYAGHCLKYEKYHAADSICKCALEALEQFDSTLNSLTFWEPSVRMRDQSVSRKVRYNIYKIYVAIYDATFNYEKAYRFEVMKNSLKDSIDKTKARKELDLLDATHKAEKTSQQIAMLIREKEFQKSKASRNMQLFIALTIITIVSVILVFVFFRHNKLKTKQEKTLLQQKLLRSQMNPHFIFNSLASIQNIIINEEPEKASRYLARFAKLIRNILDSSVNEFISLEKEISTIENYLALQKIRFPEKFDYSIIVDETIDTECIRMPPMLAQPFIENAIEHGIKHKNTKGKIRVSFGRINGNIQFEVEDDGVGRQKSEDLKPDKHKHKSLATSLTLERIAALNRNLRNKIKLDIIDLYDESRATGTRVRILIPATIDN
ncbi:MAG: histidine kinase [Bacteroidota bacterium]|nr:histidine kinase [Bacteroidota bacterium]